MTDPTSLFELHGDDVVPTALCRGPWDPGACHGGPVSALMVRACEQVDGGPWQLARITVELTRPVPVLEPLRVTTEVERPGRKVSLVAAVMRRTDGTEVCRARALRIRSEAVALPDAYELEPAFGEPGVGEAYTSWAKLADLAFVDAVELRFAAGSWTEPGPVSVWCRLTVPVVPGEEPSGAQRAAAAADFGNGVSHELDAEQQTFINPDLTVHLLRPPQGEWIGMQTRSFYGPDGAGLAESALFDRVGRTGRSAQSLLIAPR